MGSGAAGAVSMKRLLKLWQSFWTSKQTALLRAENTRLRETAFALQDENERLQAELRAAVNNLLAQAGAAPLPPHEDVKPPVRKLAMRRLTFQQRQRLYAVATMPKPDERKAG